MSQDRSISRHIALVLPVVLIVSMLLMMNVSSAAPSGDVSSSSSSSTPLWGFNGAYMNYSNVQANNTPPSNLTSIKPYWLFDSSYANYTFSMTSSGITTEGSSNATIFYVNASSMNYSVRVVSIEKISESYANSTTYANNTTIAMNAEFTSAGPTNTVFPALSSPTLYFMDSGFLLPIKNVTVRNGVDFTALNMAIKSDEFIMANSTSNLSYYASYGSGLILNVSGNGSGISFSMQIKTTNVPVSAPPPFTLGMRTSTSYTKYEITSLAPKGNFTVSVTGNTRTFGNPSGSSFNGTFSNPEGLPVLNMTDLSKLNAGETPPMFNSTGLTVQRNVTITVAAGTFVTDEISGSIVEGNGTMHMKAYFDSISGVATLFDVNFSMQISGLNTAMNLSMSLSSTNIPMAPSGYGFLAGSVTPSGAVLVVNGIIVPVYNGTYNVSLEPGNYYLSATMNGFQGKVYNVSVSEGRTTHENVLLTPIRNSVTLSGRVTPIGSSVLVNGFMAYVNATGYYSISVPTGKYTVSAYHEGYFPMSRNLTITSSLTENFNLMKEPAKANSSVVRNGTAATGYNVTVSGLVNGNGLVSVNFTATTNGTLTVSIPYNDMKNATIAEILNSSVYINGVRDKNFSITLTSNYTVILTVYNLSGDPTLYWTYSPSAVLPPSSSSSSPPTSLLEDGIAIAAIVVVVALIGVVMARRKKQSNR
ncbi:MAG: peptidase associated/transthyretin-like domain-containing protein [Thermoplasmataceae archaeon]